MTRLASRVDLLCRWLLVIAWLIPLLFGVLLLADAGTQDRTPVLLLTVPMFIQFVVVSWVSFRAVDQALGRKVAGAACWWWSWITTAVAAIGAVLAFVGTPTGWSDEWVLSGIGTAVAALAVGLGTRALVMDARRSYMLSAILGGLVWITTVAVVSPSNGGIVAGLLVGCLVPEVVVSARMTLWLIRAGYELEAARATTATLVVAEERLRIARDLHDSLGRSLTVIAMRADLGAEIATRRDDPSGPELELIAEQARHTAELLRETVHEVRRLDFVAELGVATHLLESIGATVVVDIDDATPPAECQELLATIIREAATNILRHASPRTVRITTDHGGSPESTTLTITNDGVPKAVRNAGTGLTSLADRVRHHGGSFDAASADRQFTITARVPWTSAKEAHTAQYAHA